MKKQILAVMVGLSVLLSGCSTQSTESMLQEVKKEVKEIKSGKISMQMSIKSEKSGSNVEQYIEMNGDEKFDPLEASLKGKISINGKEIEAEDYYKDGVYYSKVGGPWVRKKSPADNENWFNFKEISLNMKDKVLDLLDNKDNWDTSNDGDKITFKLKKTDELNKKIKEEYDKIFKYRKELTDIEYTVEYVYNKKTKKVEKLVYELNSKGKNISDLFTAKGTLEEVNKEVKIEVPEESKKAKEMGN
jgi:lipoprotein